MAEPSPTISIRLPLSTRQMLDKVAKSTRRSRSFIMKEALDHHLANVIRGEEATQRKPLSRLMAMRGIAVSLGQQPRTKEEVDAHIRWLRDDD